MGSVGKTQQLSDQVVVARAEAQLAGLKQGGDRMGAADLAACWPHCDQSRELALEQLTDRRAIGEVFYQHGIRRQPPLVEVSQGVGEELHHPR